MAAVSGGTAVLWGGPLALRPGFGGFGKNWVSTAVRTVKRLKGDSKTYERRKARGFPHSIAAKLLVKSE
jgi:hypothetical protein